MPITVELQGMHSYSILMIIIPVLILITATAITIFLCVKGKTTKKKGVMPVPVKKAANINMIKQKYIAKLTNLEKKHYNKKISNRYAYHELSSNIRHFVYEATGIKVQNYTLEDIKKINMPKLYVMVQECYVPEFARDNDGNIYASIKKARKVIEEWN